MSDTPTEEPCATVAAGEEPVGGWFYHVPCKRLGREVRGWKQDRRAAVAEACFWVTHFGCDREECSGCGRKIRAPA
jgi:hypothetical protein